jgi:TetR/AcrR family transcriptional regulator, transcriptional repressor for nem operon
MTTTRSRNGATASRALDVAEALVQKRGFNDFSYADVAAELGITTASLHYHFPSKAELGVALIQRYSGRFAAALAKIDEQQGDAPSRLSAFAELYEEVMRRGRMCLCGMLASDFETLSEAMQSEVRKFFEDTETWLSRVLESGREDGSLRFTGAASDVASLIVAGLEGAMLVAKPYGDVSRFHRTAAQLIAGIVTAGAPA